MPDVCERFLSGALETEWNGWEWAFELLATHKPAQVVSRFRRFNNNRPLGAASDEGQGVTLANNTSGLNRSAFTLI